MILTTTSRRSCDPPSLTAVKRLIDPKTKVDGAWGKADVRTIIRRMSRVFSSFLGDLNMKHALWASTALALLTTVPASATEAQKYRYDAKGRLLKVERTGTVNNGVTTEYTNDKADNRTRLKTTGSPNPPPP